MIQCNVVSYFIFFFQAEDGIRDRNVTGVQTCALPILLSRAEIRGRRKTVAALDLARRHVHWPIHPDGKSAGEERRTDRKSTRLNSSHVSISYAVFCLKKKKKNKKK